MAQKEDLNSFIRATITIFSGANPALLLGGEEEGIVGF